MIDLRAAGCSADQDIFLSHLATEALPHYAVPLFLRVSKEAQVTANFKLKKVDLRNEGYDPSRCEDDLYVLDDRAKSYLPYSAELLVELDINPFSRE